MNTAKIKIKVGRELYFINCKDIIVIKADNIYSCIYTSDRKCFVASHKMHEMENILDPLTFLKTHRSYLININFIERYVKTDSEIYMQGIEFSVPVARGLKTVIEEKLQFSWIK